MDIQLTEMQQKFVEHFVELGDQGRAAELAGYKQPRIQGSELRRKLAEHIEAGVREKISNYVPMALRTIAELAESAEQPAVRLKASSEILSRAGLDATQKVQQTNLNSDSERPEADLRAELTKVLSRMAIPIEGLGEELIGQSGAGKKDITPALTHAH